MLSLEFMITIVTPLFTFFIIVSLLFFKFEISFLSLKLMDLF